MAKAAVNNVQSLFLRTLSVRKLCNISGTHSRHFASQDGPGEQSTGSDPTLTEPPSMPEESPPPPTDERAGGRRSTNPPAPKISLDLLRRRQAQRKDHEMADKFISPEFFPPMGRRSKILDYLDRQDCFRRRTAIEIPEFYVGSILAVTLSDPYARGKITRFVGICVERKNYGLGASFKLRNIIDGQGMEIIYELYNPLIQKLEVLKLEKRLDAHLLYLRDALPEYSTIDPDMIPIKHPAGRPVPLNDIVVKMKPKPWHRKWERYELKGLDPSNLNPRRLDSAADHYLPEHKKMDLLVMMPRYSITEKDRMRIEREWEVHQEELKEMRENN